MATLNTVKAILSIRNDLSANWAEQNPVLKRGELVAENDTKLLKLGDGVTPYNNLPYINATLSYVNQELGNKLDKTGGTVTGVITLDYTPSASTDAVNKGYVDELIGSAGTLKREVVNQLPSAAEAEENVIYMLKDNTAIGPDVYQEYMLIGGQLVMIGDTSVDLTNYIEKPVSSNAGNLTAFAADGSVYDTGLLADDVVTVNNEDTLIINCGSASAVL